MKKKKGFTLIELLVVIAIIGLLSTLAVISLNGARAKARDAQRLSDVKQMATAIEIERANFGDDDALDGCDAADVSTVGCTGPGEISQFPNFTDPNGTAVCAPASEATCQYSIANSTGDGAPLLGDYQICFYLEQAAGNLTDGPVSIRTGALIQDDCN